MSINLLDSDMQPTTKLAYALLLGFMPGAGWNLAAWIVHRLLG